MLDKAEGRGHKGTADIGGRHLQADDRRAVFLPEIGWCHMLNGGINRPHAGSDHQKANHCRVILGAGDQHQKDACGLHSKADANQSPITEPVGDKARDQSAQHQSTKDQGAEGGDQFLTQPFLGSGKIARRPQETGCFAGTVGEEREQRQHNAGNLQRVPNSRGFPGVFIRLAACLPKRQREYAYGQNADLYKGRPSIPFIPARVFERKRHNVGADDRAESVEAVQQVHDLRRIAVRHIVIQSGVHRTGAQARMAGQTGTASNIGWNRKIQIALRR